MFVTKFTINENDSGLFGHPVKIDYILLFVLNIFAIDLENSSLEIVLAFSFSNPTMENFDTSKTKIKI